jgi:two-component system invasion response regulator UvrY
MLRVLIADDHEIVRRGLKQILLEGFSPVHIEEVSDGAILAEKAMNGKWDIVITDIAMPGGGGLDALGKIKTQDPLLPVLVVSNYPEEQYAHHVILAGADGYLSKDVAPDELVETVKKILAEKYSIRKEIAEQTKKSNIE